MTRLISLAWRPLAAAALMTLATTAQAVGRAEVRFLDPQTYTDAGFGPLELERTQRQLTAHFERLARKLPDGHVLQVELRDIDLAGEVDTLSVDRVRVMGRVPDRPLLALRYQLLAGGQVLKQGSEVLTDNGYLDRGSIWERHRGEPLAYERRMLDRWFAEHVAP